MNAMNVVSAECSHTACSSCTFEDCACSCHTVTLCTESGLPADECDSCDYHHDCGEDTCVCAEVFEDDPTDMRGPGDEE